MSKPKWCRCKEHEHEDISDGYKRKFKNRECNKVNCLCFKPKPPPTKKMKFSEMLLRKFRNDEDVRSENYALVMLMGRTLDHFLPEIDVPDEEEKST